MKKLILGLTAALLCPLAPLPAFAGPVEDAKAAFADGQDELGVSLLRNAAQQGDADAQYEIAWLYVTGTRVPQSYKNAAMWTLKAAEQGHTGAQYAMYNNYESGRGVEKSEAKSVYWLKKAAENGRASAQYAYANRLHHGKGVPKDVGAAIIWYKKAADQGHSTAQEELEKLKDWQAPKGVASTPAPAAQTGKDSLGLCVKFMESPEGLPDQIVYDTCVTAFYDAMETAQKNNLDNDMKDVAWAFAGRIGLEAVKRKVALEDVSPTFAPSPELCLLVSRTLLAYRQIKGPENRANKSTLEFLDAGQEICRGQQTRP